MAAKKSKKSKKSSGLQKVKIDFGHKDAQGGGGRVRVPEGEYLVKSTKVEYKEAQSGNPMIVWHLEIQDGKYKGKTFRTNTMLMPRSLWVLRNLLEAAGMKVPNKMVNLSISKLTGLEFGVAVMDEEYDGRVYSDVKDFVSPDLIGEGDDEDDEDEDIEDEDDEDSDEDEDDEDDDEDEDDEDEEDLEELDLEDL